MEIGRSSVKEPLGAHAPEQLHKASTRLFGGKNKSHLCLKSLNLPGRRIPCASSGPKNYNEAHDNIFRAAADHSAWDFFSNAPRLLLGRYRPKSWRLHQGVPQLLSLWPIHRVLSFLKPLCKGARSLDLTLKRQMNHSQLRFSNENDVRFMSSSTLAG